MSEGATGAGRPLAAFRALRPFGSYGSYGSYGVGVACGAHFTSALPTLPVSR